MRVKIIVIMIVLSVVVSGCSQLSNFSFGGDRTGPEEKNHGPGLEMSFDIEEEFIPRLRYRLTLENNGEQSIEIDKEQMQLQSSERTVNGEQPFVEEDITTFKQNIFEENTLTLGPHQTREYTGVLRVKPQYYEDPTNDKVSLQLEVEYPYSTEFSTNVELNAQDFDFQAQRFELSGPVEITNIEGRYSSEEKMDIIYTLRDRGGTSSSIQLEDLTFQLGSQTLSCTPYKEEDGVKIEADNEEISSENSQLFMVCPVDTSQYSSTTTSITTGEFSYTYNLESSEEISFPDTRSTGGFQ